VGGLPSLLIFSLNYIYIYTYIYIYMIYRLYPLNVSRTGIINTT
jgi:hypothetical protein